MEKVLTHYGLKPIGSKQLDGYDSLNHKIETEEETFVLKIYTPTCQTTIIFTQSQSSLQVIAFY